MLLPPLSAFRGFEVVVVDGYAIRALVDIDFVAGGNPARYAYVPLNELWIEGGGVPEDMAADLLHEWVECRDMLDHGTTYDVAHDRACDIERKFRTAVWNGEVTIPSAADICGAVDAWLTQCGMAA